MNLIVIETEFASFYFKSNKEISEESIQDEDGNLNDEIVDFIMKSYNLDSDCYSDIKQSPYEVLCVDFDSLKEW